ncbi:MAG: transposase [Chloroflexi bacterium]|nr:transposase [Chloroflexota bacterium]
MRRTCCDYLVRRRWPDGFTCPRCGSTQPPWTTARRYPHRPSV